jgi:hypothetical protein
MNEIKRFNESLESGVPTHAELLNLVKNGNIKLINAEEDSIEDYINMLIKYNKNKDILKSPIGIERNGLIQLGESFVFLHPNIIIGEYELLNPFTFGEVVICPGHDSITCYDKKTGESKTSYIR